MSTDFATEALQSIEFATTCKKSTRSLPAVLRRDQICERIKQAREETGMSQEEFADVLGVHKRSVGNWESADPDKQIVPYDRINDISEATGCSVRWLLHGEDWLSAHEWADIRDIKTDLAALKALLGTKPATDGHKAGLSDGETR